MNSNLPYNSLAESDLRAIPSLGRFCRTILPELLAAAKPARVLQTARDIVATDRWNSFDRFHETSRTLLAAYQDSGAGAERYEIPTGGTRGDGKWIIPQAEDFHEATLDLIEPTVQRLADYRACPWNVVQWSAATLPKGITCELAVIDTPEQLAQTANGSLAGRIILTRLNPVEHLSKFVASGSAGLVCDRLIEHCPDAVPWTKFGWGGINLADAQSKLFGFSISAPAGDSLRELHRQHGRLVMRARVDVRTYSGSHDVVSGIIAGREDPDAEIWAVAHSAEPGALDNASGVAACVEIAWVINTLIQRGQLPAPRRTIRLLHGYECYAFFHYLENVKRLQPPLAGVCIDTLGARPSLCGGELRWHATAPASAPFVNDIGATILRQALAQRPIYTLKSMPFVSTEDTLLGDPIYGFPCPWITNHPATGYHSSADTIDLIDGDGLALCTAAMAGYLYYLADAETDEALEIARSRSRSQRAGSEDRVSNAAFRARHRASVKRLRRFVSTGDHAPLTESFDALKIGDDASVGNPLQSSIDPRSTLIPLRRMPLAPTPENVRPPLGAKLGRSFPKWAVYWADGKRSLSDIAAFASLDAETALELPAVIDHFEAMAELGYVDLVQPEEFLNESQLTADLAALGVRPGMDLIVHSSLRSIGPVRGGADTMVRALLAAIGRKGTLLAPTFNHHLAHVFNSLTTPTNDGAIPEALWRRADAQRSLHPSHSVAAIGPRAGEFLRDHLSHGVWSRESPIGRLIESGGFILSIGVGHDRSTAYHIAEISLNVPCLDQFGSVDRIVQSNGEVQTVRGLAWRADECPVDPRGLDERLKTSQRHGLVGRAPSTLARAADVFAARIAQLGDRCRTCPVRPHRRGVLGGRIAAESRRPTEDRSGL